MTEFKGIHCEEIDERFKEYIVLAKDEKLKEFAEHVSKKERLEQIFIFSSSYRNLTKYTNEELLTHFEANDKEWKDWCADVGIFMVFRCILLKKPIPLVNIPEDVMNNYNGERFSVPIGTFQ